MSDLPGSAYLFALGTISTTFVGFAALIMIFRQTAGGGLTRLDSWITLVFIQLGFLVTAGSLAPPLLWLYGCPAPMIWRTCSAAVFALVLVFDVSYPFRRHAVSRVRTPAYVWLDLLLLSGCVAVLGANAAGWSSPSAAGPYALGLTGVLFVAGLGYLHALGALHHHTPPVKLSQEN